MMAVFNKKTMSSNWKENAANKIGAEAVIKAALKDMFQKSMRVFTGRPKPSKIKEHKKVTISSGFVRKSK